MDKINVFSKIFLMMPSNEAAQCLVLLSREDQLALLAAAKSSGLSYIPDTIVSFGPRSLRVFEQTDEKIGDILMNMAGLVGDNAVYCLLEKWAAQQPLIWQELRSHIFFFEEIVYIENRVLQFLLREHKLSPLMLAFTSDETKAKLLANVSRRIGGQVLDDYAGLDDTVKVDGSVYQSKAQFCRSVVKMLKSGEIAEIEYPVPEFTEKACMRDVRYIWAALLRMDQESRSNFLDRNFDPAFLQMLFSQEQGQKVKQVILPLLPAELRQEIEAVLAEEPPPLNMKTVRMIEAGRKSLL
ncbi:MAG: hypothetical protein LLG02_16380 [Pelosinus sp.]|nr:hypothetical protein [Pelosinus sp.]